MFWETGSSGKGCILPASVGNSTMGHDPVSMSSENPACITVKKTDMSEVDMPKGAEAIFDLMAGAFVVSVHLCFFLLSLSLSVSLS